MLAVPLAALAGAGLALGLVLFADLTGLTTLGVPLEAGAERMQGVQDTVVIWLCSVSAPVAVWLATLRRAVLPPLRAAAALVAAVTTLAAVPLVRLRSTEYLRETAHELVVTGAVLGAVVALLVAWQPRLGAGIAAHVAVLGLVGAAVRLVFGDVTFYAGLSETLFGVPAVLVLAGVLARRIRVGGGSRLAALAVGAVGPVVAVAAYHADPGKLYLWNEHAVLFAQVAAGLALLVSGGVALLPVRARSTPTAAAG